MIPGIIVWYPIIIIIGANSQLVPTGKLDQRRLRWGAIRDATEAAAR
jgi:hypothetical protein